MAFSVAGQNEATSPTAGLRDRHERLLLTHIKEVGPIAGKVLAERTGLSAQTVSVILRQLEAEGLVVRGAPMRGKVGKPLYPVALAPDGAYSIGLKIGRRSADVALVDFEGRMRERRTMTFAYPVVDDVFAFLDTSLAAMRETLPAVSRNRIVGIGVCHPFELWRWPEPLGAPPRAMDDWNGLDVAARIATFSNLPVSVVKDTTAACHAETALGTSRCYSDYAYFFIGAFIGGGVVMNGAVHTGRFGNAGALGALQVTDADDRPRQLLERASLNSLFRDLHDAGGNAIAQDDAKGWDRIRPQFDSWCDRAARDLARAALSACAVIDFEAIVIDGALPPSARDELVARVRAHIGALDDRGLIVPHIAPGSIGPDARVIGAAHLPLHARHFSPTMAMHTGAAPQQEPVAAR